MPRSTIATPCVLADAVRVPPVTSLAPSIPDIPSSVMPRRLWHFPYKTDRRWSFDAESRRSPVQQINDDTTHAKLESTVINTAKTSQPYVLVISDCNPFKRAHTATCRPVTMLRMASSGTASIRLQHHSCSIILNNTALAPPKYVCIMITLHKSASMSEIREPRHRMTLRRGDCHCGSTQQAPMGIHR